MTKANEANNRAFEEIRKAAMRMRLGRGVPATPITEKPKALSGWLTDMKEVEVGVKYNFHEERGAKPKFTQALVVGRGGGKTRPAYWKLVLRNGKTATWPMAAPCFGANAPGGIRRRSFTSLKLGEKPKVTVGQTLCNHDWRESKGFLVTTKYVDCIRCGARLEDIEQLREILTDRMDRVPVLDSPVLAPLVVGGGNGTNILLPVKTTELSK